MEATIRIAVADDHGIIRDGLETILADSRFRVTVKACNGAELLSCLKHLTDKEQPEIALVDIGMPLMDGYHTTAAMTKQYPAIKVAGLSVFENLHSVLQLLHCGAKGFIKKGVEKEDLIYALEELLQYGSYYAGIEPGILHYKTSSNHVPLLSDKEKAFLKFCCRELTYREIADRLYLSVRTIHHYRDTLYEKLHLKTRTGLVVYALQSGLVLPQDLQAGEDAL